MPDLAYDFDILIAGVRLENDLRDHVVGLSLEENLEQTSEFRFTFRPSDSRTLETITGRPYAEVMKLGQPVELKLGYWRDLISVFTGTIERIEPSFPESGECGVVVTAYDRSYKVKAGGSPSEYTGADHADLDKLAKSIIKRHGLTPVIGKIPASKASAGQTEEKGWFQRVAEDVMDWVSELLDFKLQDDQSITQDDETDWQILADIARRVNYNLFCKFDKVFMVPDDMLGTPEFNALTLPDITISPLTFVYRPQTEADYDVSRRLLSSFSPDVGSFGQRVQVEIISWDVIDVNGQKISKDRLKNLPTSGQNYTELTVESERVETLRLPGVVAGKTEQRRLAKAALEARAARLVKGDVVLAGGEPTLGIGQRHQIMVNDMPPVGKQFTGEYLITAVRHEIDGSGRYTTSFDVRRDGLTEV